MNFDHIFVVTYGRSGSTLLQGILNSIDGVCVRGENGGVLERLAAAHAAAAGARHTFGQYGHSPENPWFGAGGIESDRFGREISAAFVRDVLCPPPGARAIGFKEVRYPLLSDAEFEEFLGFVRAFFSRPLFILHTRSIDDTLASLKRNNMRQDAEQLRHHDRRMRRLAAFGAADTFHTHYDDFAGRPEALRPLFSLLGAEFDHDRLSSVLSRRHSVFSAPAQ